MKKQNNKEFKLNIINLYKSGKPVKLLSKEYNVSWHTIYLWIKTYNSKGEESLEWGYGTQIKSGTRKRGVANKPLELMTKKKIYEYAKQFEELSKYLSLSVKNKYKKIYELSNIYTIVSLCKIFKVSRAGYHKWLCLGKPKYNKWNNLIADIIQSTYHNFKRIYGYNMIALWLKKLYDLDLKPWVVYRYMKQMKLKAIIRKKRFNYKKLSDQLRYENILNRNFSTTGINQKIGTDITYLTTNNKTYYLSIVKDFHTNEILDYQISKTLDMPFVLKNILMLE
ncbi:helix-turn-helix domain-containing protein [Spiroplasma endosymbiont of Poecilobothrus nobilitatus]|uniref:helix-turn-helix domain-containing protein n=1 Tax=Spiroplasma endosymbiont of Poecilobothrus nobilitatus TaxID=1209220 RepID=UPI00313C1AF3